MTEYERGQKDLAEEIWNIIIEQKNNQNAWFSLKDTIDNNIYSFFDNMLWLISQVLKEKKNETN